MKKTTYTASVYYLTDGEQQKFENLSAENAEAINAQAHAGLDLHWFMENEGTMYEFLIPWEAVLSVAIQKVVTDETAPTDAICESGGADNPDFQFVLSDTPYIAVGGRQDGECYFMDIPIASFTVDGVTYDSSTPEAMEAITYTLTINGKDYEYDSNQRPPFDCSEILNNTVVSVTLVGHYQGVDSAPFQFEGYIYG